VNADNVDDLEFPDPNDPARYANYPKQPLIQEDRFVISTISFSLFERAWTLAGMENLLIAMCADKPFAHRLLERVLEFNLAVINHACSYGVDAMHFGDDWGQQRGLLMGYDLWKEFIEPCLRAQYKAVKDRGKAVVIHSCGKVDELFPDLIEDGLDVFNPFQPEVIDVFDAKKRYGDQLCFYGGISTQRTLPYAAVSEVKEEIKRLIDKVGKNGGYFAAPAHSIPADAKPENIAAMIEVLQNQ
jgi:uroporphyrinogen decarboxylase